MGKWEELEKVFENRVARALHSLSVPNKKDIDALGKRVAELTVAVEKLSQRTARSAKPAATSPTKARARA